MTPQPEDVLAQLSAAGVSVWLDDISRERLTTGNLAGLIRDCPPRAMCRIDCRTALYTCVVVSSSSGVRGSVDMFATPWQAERVRPRRDHAPKLITHPRGP